MIRAKKRRFKAQQLALERKEKGISTLFAEMAISQKGMKRSIMELSSGYIGDMPLLEKNEKRIRMFYNNGL